MVEALIGKMSLRMQWLVILGVSFLIYLPTISFDFTLDDAIVIYDNAYTTEGLSGIPDLLTYDTFRGFFKVEGKEQLVSGGRYRPLTPVIFAVLWELAGRTPWVFHLVNILIYSLLCGGILLALNRLLPDQPTVRLMSFFGALFFAVHPVHVEVVANVKGMDELLSLGLGLLSLYLLVRKKTLLSGLAIFLALMSKEMAITWLLVAPLYFLTIQRNTFGDALKKCLPLFIGASAYIVIRLWVVGWPASGQITEMMNNPFLKWEDGVYVAFTLSEKLATIFHSFAEYLRLMVFPLELTHDYYPRHIGVMNWSMPSSWIGMLATAGMTFVAGYFVIKRQRPILAFSVGTYLLGLILISNLIFPIGTHMGERFIFMSSFGFSILFGLAWVAQQKVFTTGKWAIYIYLALLTFLTIQRAQVWKNDHTLFTTDVKTSAYSAKALNAAGGAIIDRCIGKRQECTEDQLDLAIGYLERALEIHPQYKNALFIKGNGHFLKEEYEQAISHYEAVLNMDPGFEKAKENLVISLNLAAQEKGEKENKVNEAISLLGKALEIEPDNLETLRLLGVAYGVKGETDKAIQFFSRILEIDPDHTAANRNLGVTYMRMGEEAKAKTYLEKANKSENQ